MQKRWYRHFMPEVEILDRLEYICNKLDLVYQRQEKIMATQADIAAALAKVQADVTAQTTVEASVVTFIQGLQAQITALAGQTTDTTTATALTALSIQLESNTAGLSTAIAANTPVATPPTS